MYVYVCMCACVHVCVCSTPCCLKMQMWHKMLANMKYETPTNCGKYAQWGLLYSSAISSKHFTNFICINVCACVLVWVGKCNLNAARNFTLNALFIHFFIFYIIYFLYTLACEIIWLKAFFLNSQIFFWKKFIFQKNWKSETHWNSFFWNY